MPGRAFSCVASTSGSLLILNGLSGVGSGVRTAQRSCCFSPTHSLTKCFLVLKFLLPVRFLSGAGELLCGGLVSGA